MSHRKFRAPRHGSLGFLPRKRTRKHRGKVRSFPRDSTKNKPHFTAFMGFKAGMTHVQRFVQRPQSKLHNKEVNEAVTIIETPPMKVIGMVGYIKTPRGLRALTTIWAQNIDKEAKRNFYKNWYHSKKKCFSKYVSRYSEEEISKLEAQYNRIIRYCKIVRAICHT
jgi:large subunit ribosomal protein L3e